jgi:hypothetical protein
MTGPGFMSSPSRTTRTRKHAPYTESLKMLLDMEERASAMLELKGAKNRPRLTTSGAFTKRCA